MLLLVGGALLTSLQRVLAVDIGFRPERLLTAQVSLPQTRYSTATDVRSLLDRLLTRFRQLPDVEAAGFASAIPFSGAPSQNMILAEGYQMAPGESLVSAQHVSVSDGYFEALGARLVAGRWFNHGDIDSGHRVIIIDEKLARKFFPGGDAVGRRMWELRGTERIFQQPPDDQMLAVVGVVAEVRLSDVVDDPGVRSNGACYYPHSQRTARAVGFAIRTAGEPAGLVGCLRRALAELDPELALFDVDTADNLIDRSLVDRRTPALLVTAFAVVALFLAIVGVYGVIAYQVSQRTREIGLRMALGADARRIFGLVLSEGAVIIATGKGVGVLGATLLRHTIETQLYQTNPMELGVLIAVGGVLVVVALLATAIPARRAAKTEPNIALTHL
jgi:putative ABC transport system permease protein